MNEQQRLAERFEAHRPRLQAVAARMLGSAAEAEDAVQETWLRLSRTGAGGTENLAAWLQTVLSRICLNQLSSGRNRREQWAGGALPDRPDAGRDPEDEAVLVDAVGRALLVVLDRLSPAERVALVLHDMFGVPFGQIGPIVERTPAAARKLASRARDRVRGTATVDSADLPRHRKVVESFLAASRAGDFTGLLQLLDPDVLRRADAAALPVGAPLVARGARSVAEETMVFGRRARFAVPALVDGDVGIVVAPSGRLAVALTLTFAGDRILGYAVIGDPARLAALELAVLDPVQPVGSMGE